MWSKYIQSSYIEAIPGVLDLQAVGIVASECAIRKLLSMCSLYVDSESGITRYSTNTQFSTWKDCCQVFT